MVPACYPSKISSTTGLREAVVYALSSVSGLVRWSDYIPVKLVASADAALEGRTDAGGFIPMDMLSSNTGLMGWVDYLPVYIDNSATDAWAITATGFIPYAASGGGSSIPDFYLNLSNAVNVTLANTQARGSLLVGGGGGVITPSVSAARTSGVAPLYVNFDATGTTSTLSTNPTHELLYSWTFDDAGAGTWANGVQSAGLTSKNAAFGPVTGHVFETPGTYVVNLIVMDGVNTETMPVTITVQDPNTVYAGTDTICISHSGNFTGAPSGATQITAGSTDMYAAWNTHKASNKRILFCKADAWTCTAPISMTNYANLYLGGYGTGVSPTFGSGTMVSVTPSALGNSVFRTTDGCSDLRICNFKITANSNTSAVSLNDSISQALIYKVEVRGGPAGFDAYPGGGGTNNVFDQHCMYECLIDDLDSGSGAGGFGVFVGLVRGGIMGCYFDNCNYGEGTVRIPYIDRGHINNNYIARPNKTKCVLKIHSFVYTEVALYSEKFVVGGNVLDLRGGYAYNGTTVTEVGESYIRVGNGGVAGYERVRNGIVENNYTYGCRESPKQLVFGMILCPNMTIRNNIADFMLGTTSAPYSGTFSDRGAIFCFVGTSVPADPTVGVRIYNNSMYCNMDNGTSPMIWITESATAQVEIKNNISYQPYIGYWADKIVYVANGATTAAYTATNNTVNQNTNPNFTATPPVTLADWKPATGSYAINGGAPVPVLRDFNNASRYGAGNHMGAVLP